MSEDHADAYVLLLPISLIVFGVFFCSFFKKGKSDRKNQRAAMAVNAGGFWAEEKLQKLRCSVKNYDWGRIGVDSEVYRLSRANSGAKIDPDKPYAEFWMGTHESGSSRVVRKAKILASGRHCDSNWKLCDVGGPNLKSWIERHPAALGDKVRKKWGSDLPFLFKVLSIAKPLSIQAHPCKELARKLHMKDPNVYKDANHKPEMALAITEFEALCGFVGLEELQIVLKSVPEISLLVGSVVVDRVSNMTTQDSDKDVKSALKQLFTQLMSASEHEVAAVLSQLTTRLRRKDKVTEKEQLVLRLEEQYPNDIGVLAAFLMNYMKLNPGEALCLGANELHAYISGDCVECMATSDNVVRAGLTPKQRDVETLCNMLTYKQGAPDILRGFNVEGSGGCTKRYRPPFEEFEVDHCHLSKGKSTIFQAMEGPSLFLVTGGTGMIRMGFSIEKISVGDVLFAPANTKLSIQSEIHLELYRAGVNTKYL